MKQICIDEGKELCPREVYCPDFESVSNPGAPVYGATDQPDNWAPIPEVDGVKDWIVVGNADDHRLCQTHVEAHGWPASNTWGGSGHNSNQILLCCGGFTPLRIQFLDFQRKTQCYVTWCK